MNCRYCGFYSATVSRCYNLTPHLLGDVAGAAVEQSELCLRDTGCQVAMTHSSSLQLVHSYPSLNHTLHHD